MINDACCRWQIIPNTQYSRYRDYKAPWSVDKQVMWLVVTEVRRLQSVFITTHVICFIVECSISRFLYAMQVFKVRASPPPLGYLCAKFRYCGDLHCWASPWRKITYAITQLPSLFDDPRTEHLASENKKLNTLTYHVILERLQRCHDCERLAATTAADQVWIHGQCLPQWSPSVQCTEITACTQVSVTSAQSVVAATNRRKLPFWLNTED